MFHLITSCVVVMWGVGVGWLDVAMEELQAIEENKSQGKYVKQSKTKKKDVTNNSRALSPRIELQSFASLLRKTGSFEDLILR